MTTTWIPEVILAPDVAPRACAVEEAPWAEGAVVKEEGETETMTTTEIMIGLKVAAGEGEALETGDHPEGEEEGPEEVGSIEACVGVNPVVVSAQATITSLMGARVRKEGGLWAEVGLVKTETGPRT